ncbi:hypothetical protein E2C01_032596 [Portunus trituberculatus]|uniref:Uncharacterized protein n=1 Tax=Portunus trituberculatus TaxID=210409 RepID=A0A5B7F0U8_PORTR|nr:hypothetical protein [Portunus trituberculatus]
MAGSNTSPQCAVPGCLPARPHHTGSRIKMICHGGGVVMKPRLVKSSDSVHRGLDVQSFFNLLCVQGGIKLLVEKMVRVGSGRRPRVGSNPTTNRLDTLPFAMSP